MSKKGYFVYILASFRRTLYIGVTGELRRRIEAHRRGNGSVFAARYRVARLVHLESCRSALDALRREKQLKGWKRQRKIALIESANPGWLDLSERELP